MVTRVQLFPNVTVSPEIALTLPYMGFEPRVPTTNGFEEPAETLEGRLTPAVVEEYLAQKGRTRHEWNRSFGPANLHWRREGYQRSRYEHENGRPLPPKHGYLDDGVIETQDHWGTNRILDYIGVPNGGQRNDFLRQFDGDIFYGIEIIRTSFHLAAILGFADRYDQKPEARREMFTAIAQSVNKYGPQETDLLIEAFGFDKLRDAIKQMERGDSPLIVNGKVAFVPSSHLDNLVTQNGVATLGSIGGKDLMRKLGYTPTNNNSFTVYTK